MSAHLTQDSFTRNASVVCSWKKKKPAKKNSKKTKASFREKKTAISNMHFNWQQNI